MVRRGRALLGFHSGKARTRVRLPADAVASANSVFVPGLPLDVLRPDRLL